MKTLVDINSWNRKAIFEHFVGYDEPFFGVTVSIDCTLAYTHCKQNNISFFLYYLHKATAAANLITPFRYQIEKNKVYEYDCIDVSATISRADHSYGFSYFPFDPNFTVFEHNAQKEIKRIQSSTELLPEINVPNILHCSSLPWLNFTSLSHARKYDFSDSCPKISFGKMTVANEIKTMPVSIHVHHALMDGLHVGHYVEQFQKMMNAI